MTDGTPVFRNAIRADLPAIVAMLVADPIAAAREDDRDALPHAYVEAWDEIDADPNNELIVAEQHGEVVGVLQLTVIPGLTYAGGRRAQVEGVRVAASTRGRGIGAALIEEAVERARARGCRLVQLTTDKRRNDAVRFYERLGFVATHEGMKRLLE